MYRGSLYICLVLCALFLKVSCQEYDFAAEITRQCLVPDPVGLLDCVENKVTLPYLTSWVDCTNSLGQNVKTSADIINYRCKSVWEGKGVIPEVFYIKDCVIEKTGLPAKNVSAEVLGAYKECESSPNPPQQRIKTAPIQQQQQYRSSSVEYKPQNQQAHAPVVQPLQQVMQVQTPIHQVQAPALQLPRPQFQMQKPLQQTQQPFQQMQVQTPFQQAQQPFQQVQVQTPFQQGQGPFQTYNVAPNQQFAAPVIRPSQPQQLPRIHQQPIQQQIQQAAPHLTQQISVRTFADQQVHTRPAQLNQQQSAAAFRPQYQPYSQQFFTIYPQAPLQNVQQNINRGILSQKTVPNQSYASQQLISASTQESSSYVNAPYSYSFQIHHPVQSTI